MIQICSTAGVLYDPRLADAGNRNAVLNATLTMELNKAGELKLTLDPDHPRAAAFGRRTDEVWVISDGEEIFRGRPGEEEVDFYGNRTISCEGLLSYLRDEYLRPTVPHDYGSNEEKSSLNYMQLCVDTWNTGREGPLFAVGENCWDIPVRLYCGDHQPIDEALRKLTEIYGGYLCVRRENGANVIYYTEESGPLGAQIVDFGENLLDMRKKIDASDIYTRVIPLGKEREDEDGAGGESGDKLTIAAVNPGQMKRGSAQPVNVGADYLDAEDAEGYINEALIARYGTVAKTIDFSETSNPQTLLAAGVSEAKKCGGEDVTIEATAIDLRDAGADVGALRLGQRHRVRYRALGIDHVYPISACVMRLTAPEGSTWTFGAKASSMTDRQVSQQRSAAATAERNGRSAAVNAGAVSAILNGDYVKEAGGSGAWTWRKWASGAVEMWATDLETALGASTAWTSELLWQGGTVTWPIALDGTRPLHVRLQAVKPEGEAEYNGIVLIAVKKSGGATFRFVRKTAAPKVYLDVYVRGYEEPAD